MPLDRDELSQRLNQLARNARKGCKVGQRKRGLLRLAIAAKVVGDVLQRFQSPRVEASQPLDRGRAVVSERVAAPSRRQRIPGCVCIFERDMATETRPAG